jgi:two-component sensor histidine kinase
MHAYGIDPQRIECRVHVEPLREPVDRAIPTGLILNELLSNALRHAFPDNRRGTLWIEGRCRNGNVDLEVRDDGVGIPVGTDPARPKSLGFEIVRILTRQLRGVFEVERQSGTLCRVTFPQNIMRPQRHEESDGDRQTLQSASGGR